MPENEWLTASEAARRIGYDYSHVVKLTEKDYIAWEWRTVPETFRRRGGAKGPIQITVQRMVRRIFVDMGSLRAWAENGLRVDGVKAHTRIKGKRGTK